MCTSCRKSTVLWTGITPCQRSAWYCMALIYIDTTEVILSDQRDTGARLVLPDLFILWYHDPYIKNENGRMEVLAILTHVKASTSSRPLSLVYFLSEIFYFSLEIFCIGQVTRVAVGMVAINRRSLGISQTFNLKKNILNLIQFYQLSNSKNDDIQIYPVLPAFKTTIQHWHDPPLSLTGSCQIEASKKLVWNCWYANSGSFNTIHKTLMESKCIFFYIYNCFHGFYRSMQHCTEKKANLVFNQVMSLCSIRSNEINQRACIFHRGSGRGEYFSKN